MWPDTSALLRRQSKPLYPISLPSANIIGTKLHPQNFTPNQPKYHVVFASSSYPPSRHCIALQSILTAQAFDNLGTNRAGDSVFSTAVQLQVRCFPGTETQPSAPDRDPP